jgi:hypothetical protein
MCKETFKGLLKAKLRVVDSVISVLPSEIKERAVVFQKGLLEAMHEVTEEILTGQPNNKKEEGIKSVHID